MRMRAYGEYIFCVFHQTKNISLEDFMEKIKNILGKIAMALAMIMCMGSGIILFGCDDGKNMSVSVDKSSVSIFLGETEDDTVSVVASVANNGRASDQIFCSFENDRASLIKTEYLGNGKTQIFIKGNIPGSTQVKVHTKEKNKTCDFKVEVVQPLTGLNAKTGVKTYVVKGQKNKINIANLIDFEPINTSHKDVVVSIASEVSQDLAYIEQNEQGTFLYIDPSFEGDNVAVKIESSNRPSVAPVVLDFEVLNPILTQDENGNLKGINSISSSKSINQILYPQIQNGQNTIYLAHNNLDYSEEIITVEIDRTNLSQNKELRLTPVVTNPNLAVVTQIERRDSNAQKLVFDITVVAGNNVGSDCYLYFELCYNGYPNSKVDTQQIKTQILSYDLIESLYFNGEQALDVMTSDLYTSYTSSVGLPLVFDVYPTTVHQDYRKLYISTNDYALNDDGTLNENSKIILLDENGRYLQKDNDGYIVVDSGQKVYALARSEFAGQSASIDVESKFTKDYYQNADPSVKANKKTTINFSLLESVREISFAGFAESDTNKNTFFFASNKAETQTIYFDVKPANVKVSEKYIEVGADFELVKNSLKAEKYLSDTQGNVVGRRYSFDVKSNPNNKTNIQSLSISFENGRKIVGTLHSFVELDETRVNISLQSPNENSAVGKLMYVTGISGVVFETAIKNGNSAKLSINTYGADYVASYKFADCTDADQAQNYFSALADKARFTNSTNILNSALLNGFSFVSGNKVGKTQVQILLAGNKFSKETNDGITYNRLSAEQIELEKYFFVEIYNPVKSFEVSQATVTLYSYESVGFYNKQLSTTSFGVFVNLNQTPATYSQINFTPEHLNGYADVTFDSENNIAYIQALSTKDPLTQTSSEVYSDGFIKFEIEEFGVKQILNVRVIIRRATMVEGINVYNVNKNSGIYMEIGKDQYFNMDVAVKNSDAFNKNLIYTFVPDQNTNSSILTVDKWTGRITLNGTEGGTGKVVITPQDCFSGENEPVLDFDNEYSKNHIENVQLVIPITVADGRSKATAIRIQDLSQIQNNTYHYILTKSCNAISLGNFSGGLYGDSTNPPTITFENNDSLFDNFSGIIEDIVFVGTAKNAFVAKTNKGTIKNITVDTYTNADGSYTASKVLGDGENAGGLVVQNDGQISNSKFFGQIQNGNYVGGICATNNGVILECAVEFYTFADCIGELSGNVVGGLVAKMSGGKISQSYVYNYHNQNSLVATTKGALVGEFEGGLIQQSFAKTNSEKLVGNEDAVAEQTSQFNITNSFVIIQDIENDTLSNITVNIDKKYLKGYSLAYDTKPNGYTTFNSYYNANKIYFSNNSVWAINLNQNDGYPYLKDIQFEGANAITNFVMQNTDQSLCDNQNSKAILFVYEKQSMVATTPAEDAVISSWNTISFAKLFGLKSSNGVRAEFTNPQYKEYANLYSNSIVLKKAGNIQLKIFSKYDYTKNKTFDIVILNAIEDFKLMYQESQIFDGSVIRVKKSSTETFNLDFVKEKVAVDRPIALKQGDFKVLLNGKTITETGFANQTGNMFSIDTARLDTNSINFAISASILDDFNKILNQNYNLTFTLSLYNGADQISTDVSKVIRVQPLDVVKFDVTTLTDNFDEELDIQIFDKDGFEGFTEDELYVGLFENSNADGFRPYTKQVYGMETDGSWTKISQVGSYSYFKIVYSVKLQIDESYLNRPFEELDLTFDICSNLVKNVKTSVNVVYNSQSIERILFTNLNFSKWDKLTGYTFEDEPQNVVNPGKSSLLKINLYPAFADYSYVEITSSVADGQYLSLYPLTLENGYYKRQTNGYNVIDNGIRLPNNYQNGDRLGIYNILVAVPSNIQVDTAFEIVVKAYNSRGEEQKTDKFTLVTRPLVASTITIDGEDTKLMARGTYADIVVTTQLDQNLDSIKISGQGKVSGISLDKIEEIIDNEKNVKVYTTKIFVGENAYFEEQDDSSFEIVATVSRNNGGIIEERPSKVKVSVVDFLVDSINLDVDSVDKNNLNVFLGIDKYLNFAFDTTTWEDTTYLDPTIQEAITKLRANVQKFVEQNYFVANDPTGSDSYYIVNYHQGDEDYLSSTSARYKNLLNNLYYVNADGSSVKVLSASGYLNANPYFDFDYSGNGKWSDTVGGKYLKIVGKSTGTQKMRLVFAYLTPDKVKHELTFDFTITIKVYTDEDRPTQITTAEEFVAIQKQNDAQDFILMNDIELSYYVPFDTSKIKTFDGNNKIITIRSFDMSDDQTNSLNLALFSNVTADTILKNITVNYYHNDNIIVDTTTYKTINFAGFAITNNGSITNGHVLAMRTNLSLANPTNDAGINISYTCGNIPSTIQSKIAGFVLNNNGVITNSRVGGESFKKIYSNNVSVGDYALSKFTISGQGDIAGFVYENTGIISSSFANNIALTNNTKSGIETATAGFAVTNQSGSISLSYARGAYSKTNPNEIKTTGSVISTNSVGAGFVYKNNADIFDCYSNIKLKDTANNSGRNSAGFVYNNAGNVNRCYSSSIIENSLTTQMNFNGVDDYGNLLNTGEIVNCYYYSPRDLSDDSDIKDMDETYGSGVLRVENFDTSDIFYGFSFAPLNSWNGVWTMTVGKGPELISANNIAISSRYAVQTDENEFTFAFVEGYEYGSDANPILISNETEFNQVFGNSNRTPVQQYYDKDKKIAFGNYRLINNIDLSKLATEEEDYVLISSLTSLVNNAVFDGNSLTISNLELTSEIDSDQTGFGLFASILNNSAVLNTNVTLKGINASNIQNVGVIAGIVHDSTIANVNISSTRRGEISPVLGQNVAGGVAGMVFGDSSIVSAVVNGIEVSASYFDTNGSIRQKFVRTDSKQNVDNSKLSYAGGVVGILDLYYVDQYTQVGYDQEHLVSSSHAALLHAKGGTIVKAGTVGGVIGYTGQNTYVRDAQFIIERVSADYTSKIVSYGYSAGGLIGENYGDLTQSVVEHDRQTQNQIESNTSLYYKNTDGYNHGYDKLFVTPGAYSPIFVGGLVGQTFSGRITNSYSKANVIAQNADYVGGLFGGIGDFDKLRKSKLGYNYFNELYTFGDISSRDVDASSKNIGATTNVRGGVAGGIAGFCEFAEKTTLTDSEELVDIVFAGVNAVNFFSTEHDTITQTENQTTSLQFENIYDFYGATYYDGKTVLANQYDKDTALFTFANEKLDDGGSGYSYIPDIPSNHVVKNFFANQTEYRPIESCYVKNGDVKRTITDKIEPLSAITTPATDGGYMDVIFRNNHWDPYKWERKPNELLPRILFSTSTSIIYIRTADDLKLMAKYPTKTFIIYGTGPNGDKKVFVDCSTVDDDFLQNIKNFRGVLKGYKNDQDGNPLFGLSYLSNLTHALIDDTQNGAVFTDFIIANSGNADVNSFIGSAILVENANGVIFRNIILDDCQIATTSNKAALLAGLATNCMFADITVQNISKSDFVKQDTSKSTQKAQYYAGVFAGSISGTRKTIIKDCVISNQSKSSMGVLVEGNSTTEATINAGGFVGGASSGSIQIDASKQIIQSKENVTFKVEFVEQNVVGKPIYNVNLGMITGSASSMNFAITDAGMTVYGLLKMSDGAHIQNLNVGGLVGQTVNGGLTTISAQNKNNNICINIDIDNSSNTFVENAMSVLNIGGLIGKSNSKVAVSNINIFHESNERYLIKNNDHVYIQTNNSYDNIGGLIGLANDGLVCTQTNYEAITTYIGKDSLNGGAKGTVKYGGTIGYISNQSSMSENMFFVTGFVNTANVQIKNKNKVIAGGIIGAINVLNQNNSNSTYDVVLGKEGQDDIDNNIILEALYIDRLQNSDIVAGGLIGDSAVGKGENDDRVRKISLVNNQALGEVNINAKANINRDNDSLYLYLGGLVARGNKNIKLVSNNSLTTIMANRIASNNYRISAFVADADFDINSSVRNTNCSDYNLCGVSSVEESAVSNTLADNNIVSISTQTKNILPSCFIKNEEWIFGTKFKPYDSSNLSNLEEFLQNTNAQINENKQRTYLLLKDDISLTNAWDIKNFAILGNGKTVKIDQASTDGVFIKNIDQNSYIAGLNLDIQSVYPTASDYTSTSIPQIEAQNMYAPVLENNGTIYGVTVATKSNVASIDKIYVNAKTASGLVGINTGVISSCAGYLNITNVFDDYKIISTNQDGYTYYSLDIATTAGLVAQNYGDVYASFTAGQIVGDYSNVYAISHDILNPKIDSTTNKAVYDDTSRPIVSHCYTILDCTKACKQIAKDETTLVSLQDYETYKAVQLPGSSQKPVYAHVFDIGANSTCFYDIYGTGTNDQSGQETRKFITSQIFKPKFFESAQNTTFEEFDVLKLWKFNSDYNFGYPILANSVFENEKSSFYAQSSQGERYAILNIGTLQMLESNSIPSKFALAQNISISDDMGFVNNKEYIKGKQSNWNIIDLQNVDIDGNGYSISGFKLSLEDAKNYDEQKYVAIFANISNSVIKNLYLTEGQINVGTATTTDTSTTCTPADNNVYVGVLAGKISNSTLSDMTITGFDVDINLDAKDKSSESTNAKLYFGTIAGYASETSTLKDRTFEKFDVSNTIHTRGNILSNIGGLVGYGQKITVQNNEISNYMHLDSQSPSSKYSVYVGYGKDITVQNNTHSGYMDVEHSLYQPTKNSGIGISDSGVLGKDAKYFDDDGKTLWNLQNAINDFDAMKKLGKKVNFLVSDFVPKEISDDQLYKYFLENSPSWKPAKDAYYTIRNDHGPGYTFSYLNRPGEDADIFGKDQYSNYLKWDLKYNSVDIKFYFDLLSSKTSYDQSNKNYGIADGKEESGNLVTISITMYSDYYGEMFFDLYSTGGGFDEKEDTWLINAGYKFSDRGYSDLLLKITVEEFKKLCELPTAVEGETLYDYFGINPDDLNVAEVTERNSYNNLYQTVQGLMPQNGGKGTKQSPYIVKTEQEMIWCLANDKSFVLEKSVNLGNITKIYTLGETGIFGNGNFVKYKTNGNGTLLKSTDGKALNLSNFSTYNINYAGIDNALLDKNNENSKLINVKSFGLANSDFKKISDKEHNTHILSGITRENQGSITNCSNFKTLVGTDGKDGDAVSGFKENGLDGKDGISGWDANLLGGIVGTSSGNVMGCFNQGVMVGANGGNGSDGINGVDGGNADAKEKNYATDAGNGGVGGHGGNASIIGGIVAKSQKSIISGKNNATLYAGKGGKGGAGGAGGKGGDSSSDSMDVLDTVLTKLGRPIWELLDDEISYKSSTLPATAGGAGGAGGNGGASLVGSIAGTIFSDDLKDYGDVSKINVDMAFQGSGGKGGKGGNGGKSVAYMATPETGWWISVIGAGASGGGAGGNGYNGNDSSVVQICAQSINKYDSKLIEEYPDFFASSGTKGSQYSQSAGDTILYTNICEGGAGGTGNVNGFKGTSNAGTSFVPGKIPGEHGAGVVQSAAAAWAPALTAYLIAFTPTLKTTAFAVLSTATATLLSATGNVYYVLDKANKNKCSESAGGNDVQVPSKQTITPSPYGGGIPALKWEKNDNKLQSKINDLSIINSVYYTLQADENKDKYQLLLTDDVTVQNAEAQYKLCIELNGDGHRIIIDSESPREIPLFDISTSGKITKTYFALDISASTDCGKYSAWQFVTNDKSKVTNGSVSDCQITKCKISVDATKLEYILANNFDSDQIKTLEEEINKGWWNFKEFEFASGNGTKDNPYILTGMEQWNAFVRYSNLGLSGYYFKLSCNPTINLKREDASNTNFVIDTFKNHLDGNNFTLKLGQNENNDMFDGLVNINEGTIQNISISGVTKQSTVAYANIGTIDGVTVSTIVQNNGENQKDISGFVYENQGTISNSCFEGKIENNNGGAYGFAVTNTGNITGCSTDEYVTIKSFGGDAAGCVKNNRQDAVITKFVNNATITANQFNNDIISSAADVAKGNGHNAAGVAINNYGTISESTNNGAITASSASDCNFDSEIEYTYKDNNGGTITEKSIISGCSGGNAAGISIYNIDMNSISYETNADGTPTSNYGKPSIVGTLTNCKNYGIITAGSGGNNSHSNGIGGDGGNAGDICIPYVTVRSDSETQNNYGNVSGSPSFGNGYYNTKTETIVQEDGTEIQQTIVDKIFLKQGIAGTGGKQNGNGNIGKVWQAVTTGEIEEKTRVSVGDVVTQ